MPGEGYLNAHMLKPRFDSLRCRLAGGCLVLLLLSAAANAQQDVEREGYFEVRSAATELKNGVHTLDARLQLVLSSEALQALDAGVPLTVELQLEVIRSRRWIPDTVDAELKVRYELEYRPLSQRYIVRNVNTGNQESFATLYSALLESDKDYRLRMRALLNTQQYPPSLRFVFFWRSEWQLKSDWFEWSLER